ncbi:hypothetical protein BR93DRAFT_961319 [Coniochaeta sp. PMI_546]|nr:hypothetical protein BR93DRAFT_961319 [Coniochaeta sp. PMI_546]
MPPKENQPAMAPEPTEEPSPRQTAAQTAEGNTSLPGGPGAADYYLAGGYFPATPPPAPAQSNTTTSSHSQQPANTATAFGPGHRPQPRNNASALSRQSAQTVQDFNNQTMNTFNRGKSKLERFVWVPTRVPYTHAGFMNVTPATWANAWRELVRERGTAGEWYSPPMEEENEDEE